MVLIPALLMAQTINGPVIPISGSPKLVQASYTPIGQLFLEPVTLPAGVTVARSAGVLTVIVPAPPPAPSTVAWITLGQSSSDPLTWCVTEEPLQHEYTPALIHEFRGQVSTGNRWDYDVYDDIQIGPTPAGSPAPANIPPIWFKSGCGGKPGVTFPANWLQAGESRTAVQARVVF